MTNLDKIKGLIVTGDKQKAIGMLASMLIENKDEAEAWLLLGYLIDDPIRKRDCYYQVLRLFPGNSLALAKLQELGEAPPSREPITKPKSATVANRDSIKGLRQNIHFSPDKATLPLGNNSQTPGQNTGFIVIGVVGLVLVLILLGIASAGDWSIDSGNPVCGALMLFAIVGGIFLWASSNKNRGP
jgi:hypothetical protein